MPLAAKNCRYVFNVASGGTLNSRAALTTPNWIGEQTPRNSQDGNDDVVTAVGLPRFGGGSAKNLGVVPVVQGTMKQ